MLRKLAKTSDIPEGGGRAFQVDDRSVAVFRVNGRFFAIDDTCSHAQASLAGGEVFDHEVECPRHGARFDIRTGEALTLPALRPVATYEVRVDGDDLSIDIH